MIASKQRVLRVTVCLLCSVACSVAWIPAGISSPRAATHRQMVSREEFPVHQQQENRTRAIEEAVHKKIRVAKAQEEIDRILKGPDPPFDAESELQKVISISPPLRDKASIDMEHTVSQLEQDLYQAVKQQDYVSAADYQREMGQMHVDDCGDVLQVNSAFYRAFSEKNVADMEAIWLKDRSSVCIHPSHAPLVGYKHISDSWKRMFESSNQSFQRNWMDPQEIRLVVKGATAIVTCEEFVYARRFVRGKKRQTELINKLTATNIFRNVGGKWYMSYHHASWHPDSEAAKTALRTGGGVSTTSSTAEIVPKARSEEPPSLGMEGILGMNNFGPLLGGDSASSSALPPQQQQYAVKRVFMGSLSDVLNAGLGDILSNDAVGNSSPGNDDDETGIIQYEIQDDDEDEEDEDEEDVSILKEWTTASSGSKIGKSVGTTKNIDNKEGLRRSCISTLRRLCDQKAISAGEKRVLLTDIITCSAKGKFSMVEVAYELLCGEGDVDEEAEEEFAAQCQLFAQLLSDHSDFEKGLPSL